MADDLQQLVEQSELSSGVKVVTDKIPNMESVSLGFWVDVGSRDESDDLQGCSHLIEHLLFKGSKNRTANEISTIIESRGGELNAFSDRDMTCLTATVLKKDVNLAVDLFSDMVQYPIFKEADLKLERQVILNEIYDSKENPHDLLGDLFFNSSWMGSSSAHPILGDENTIKKISKDQIIDYFNTFYLPSNIIICAAGNLYHDALVEKIEFNFKEKKVSNRNIRKKPKYVVNNSFIDKDFDQVHFCIGSEGVHFGGEETGTLEAINSYLGDGMSAKLFQEIRVKRGLVYGIESDVYCMRDAGLFNVSTSTSKNNVERVCILIIKELEKLQNGMDSTLLDGVKQKNIGSLILSSEYTENRCNHLGECMIRLGKPKLIEEEIRDIESVDSDKIAKLASKLFNRNKLIITAVGVKQKEFKNLASAIIKKYD